MDSPSTKHNQIMFSLQQGDDFVDHEQSFLISFQQQEDYSPDFHEHVSLVNDMGKSSANRPESSNRKRTGNPNKPNLGTSGGSVGDGEDDKKKMAHREIEKQRRKEMAKLYASLRDLLPLEFVRGKRSISDHMHQAVDYIKQLEENVKGLGMKRDLLKKYSDTNGSSSMMNNLPNTVSASFCNGGVEILINSCSIGDGFSLSGVLTTLLEGGLSVTNCILTKLNDRFLHSIQCEASDLSVIDLSMLQQRLVFVANYATQPHFV
uniref:transcription factor bHLH118-like n=1 Tax=Erigeron canadensis TaxID=72917 RepID=UPI001CB9C39E|nr:transcription factor bHLH118-like [Erigeron canadensis]